MADISTITSTVIAGSNLVVVNPQSTVGYQPQAAPPLSLPPALLFHYEGEQTATLKSDITDHFVENNSAVQDQISLKPTIIKTSGFIGELNDVPPAALALLQSLANKLTVLGAYTPGLSATALIAYNQAFQAYQLTKLAVNSIVSATAALGNLLSGSNGQSVINGSGSNGFESIQSKATQTKQQTYFQQFYQYWFNRTLFTVQTPWAVFQNMAIETLQAIQDADTNVITDFEVTFKQIRYAFTTVSTDTSNKQGNLQNLAASLVNIGTSSPPALAAIPNFFSNLGIG